MSYTRAISSSPEVICAYYELLEETLVENDIIDKPSKIFDLDETGMQPDPQPTKVVVPKGTRHPTSITTGNKAQISVLSCCNTAGYDLPPCVIFDRFRLTPDSAVKCA